MTTEEILLQTLGLFDAAELDALHGPCKAPDAEERLEPEEETVTYTRRIGRKGTAGVRGTWENLPVL